MGGGAGGAGSDPVPQAEDDTFLLLQAEVSLAAHSLPSREDRAEK